MLISRFGQCSAVQPWRAGCACLAQLSAFRRFASRGSLERGRASPAAAMKHMLQDETEHEVWHTSLAA